MNRGGGIQVNGNTAKRLNRPLGLDCTATPSVIIQYIKDAIFTFTFAADFF